MADSLEEFLGQHDGAKPLFAAVQRAMHSIGDAKMVVTKSQVAFSRHKNYVLVWIPGQYLHGKTAPLVLTILLPRRIDSLRWKEISEPSPGHFTHHLELNTVEEVDDEVVAWLRLAWQAA